jgi:FAD/FMN-containing dehydrogenase
MRKVSSWGRLSALPHDVVELADRASIGTALASAGRPAIAFGLGRSYGDACLNPDGTLLDTHRLDRLISFDPATGRLVCEAGAVLRDIQRLMTRRGWSLPVIPGTQLVTVGGAIANDVHGKNHHTTGTFADHVVSLTLVRSDGEVIVCGPDTRRDWFAATAGGIGLTGLIVQAELQLKPSRGPWVDAEIVPYTGLDAFFELSESSHATWEHTVSWIDCTVPGLRGLFLRAREAADQSRPLPRGRALAMPLTPPLSLVNRLSLKPLNAGYYALNSRHKGVRLLHQEQFLFPLDGIGEWNRMYGPRGFYQYQSVVPFAAAREATAEMLQAIAGSGEGSVLAVLKTFGERTPPGLLSFVMPGVTLALDFANRPAAAALFARLDDIVRAAGGRLYLAKDARMSRSLFEATYPNALQFQRYCDPGMSSAMSRRLMGR